MVQKDFELLVLAAIALVIASCGPAPTARVIRMVETVEVEVEVTRQITQEVVVTATPEPTLSAIALLTSYLLFEDDFESIEGEWYWHGSTPQTSFFVHEGRLTIRVDSPSFISFTQRTGIPPTARYDFEVDIFPGFLSGSSVGVFFRCNLDNDMFLGFSILPPESFAVSEFTITDGQIKSRQIQPWAFSRAILLGRGFYRVRLHDEGREVSVFVNDELVTTFTYDYDDFMAGCPALYVESGSEGRAIWAFDNITAYRPIFER